MAQLSVTPNPQVSFKIIHEGEGFWVIEKPAGLRTQPGIKHQRDTLLNGLFALAGERLQHLGKRRDFGLLHRLDAPTSGLILAAWEPAAYDALRAAFVSREVEKGYLALIDGQPPRPAGICDGAIEERREGSRKRARVHSVPKLPRAQAARTRYQCLAQSADAALIACLLETGRLHQIRAHMASLGCPVLGDFDYGGPRPLNRQLRARRREAIALHAAALRFRPTGGKMLSFFSPPPDYFSDFAAALELAPAHIQDPLSIAHLARLSGPRLRPASPARRQSPAPRQNSKRTNRRETKQEARPPKARKTRGQGRGRR